MDNHKNNVILSFFVPGVPQPGGSKRGFVTRQGRVAIVDDARHGKDWRGDVKRFARDAYHGDPLDGPLAVTFLFFVARPRGHYGTGRNAARLKPSAPRYPTTKPDVLKLVRSTEDSCTGIIWKDDCLTVDIVARKRYGPRPGARITVALKHKDV